MSGSEGKQNHSQLSKRDIEEEEMAQELMSMEMYEEGMSFEQMKELLGFINESKNMAGIEPDNRSSQESTQYAEDIIANEAMPKNNSQRDLISEENSLPKPSFSYRQQRAGRGSPPTLGHKSTLEMVPVEGTSATSPNMSENEEPKRFTGEGESLYEKLVKENNEVTDKDEINENRSQKSQGKNAWLTASDSSQNSQNSLSLEASVDIAKSRKNQRSERWKLDPTNAVVEDNDVPLKEKTRPVVLNERVPYRFCHDRRAFDSTVGDKVLTVLTHALEEVADLWRRKHRPDVSDFQWGSPIKVGLNKRILENRNPVIEEADSPERCETLRNIPDSANRRNMDRNCKRKASEHIRELVNNSQVESDEEDDNIFEPTKKPKRNDELWEPPTKAGFGTAEKTLTRQDKIFNNLQNSNKAERAFVIDDYESDNCDLDDIRSLRKKNNKQKEEGEDALPPSEEFPRRIIPPNPSKPKARPRIRAKNGEKGKRKSPVRKNTQAVLEKNKNFGLSIARGRTRNPLARKTDVEKTPLNDEEISKELENEDVEQTVENVEIKPLPLRGLASKLLVGTSRLLAVKKSEEKLEQSRALERFEAKKEEDRQKQEMIMARYKKEKEEREEREAKELAIKAKEEAWKKNEANRNRDRRRRQAEEKKQSREAEIAQQLVEDEEEEADELISRINARQKVMENRVQCPICRLEFSTKEIEGHAANCDQFDNVDDPEPSGSPADDDEILSCHICCDFSTKNGNVYELHTKDCVNRQRDGHRSPNLLDSAATEIVQVSTSPIRCFVPISELTESAINYAEQFPEQKVKPNAQRTKRRL